jgi:hypothetical protein
MEEIRTDQEEMKVTVRAIHEMMGATVRASQKRRRLQET